MAILRGRYTGSPETIFDFDIRQIEARGLLPYAETVFESELPDSYWTGLLPQVLDTSSAISPYFLAYKAAQAKAGDLGFLSRDIKVLDLLLNRTDVHHLYPRNHLIKHGLARGRYNQIGNFAPAQSEINIAIGDRSPEVYFAELADQCSGGQVKYGGITDVEQMRANLQTHSIPVSMLDGVIPEYDDFLEQRRMLMAEKLRSWYQTL